QASPELRDFDVVVEAAGQEVKSGGDLAAIFAQQPLGPINLKVERQSNSPSGQPDKEPAKQPEKLEVVVQAKPMRELGLAMKIGPIVAIQKGSPAEKSELQAG